MDSSVFRGRSSDSAFMLDYGRKQNQVIIKEYSDESGNVRYKLIFMRSVKTRGIEEEKRERSVEYENSEKFESSLVRSKSMIFDLAFCNPWEYFFTGTLDSNKYDREDLKTFHFDFTQWIRNFNRIHCCNIKFLIVPELHNDNKSWHFHGFIMGLPSYFLLQFHREDFYPYSEKRLPYKLLYELDNGYDVFSWVSYQDKFGWNTLEPIKDHQAVSCYVTKYITKDVLKSVSEVGAHTYFRSRGLKVSKVVFSGSVDSCLIDSLDYSIENEYCKVAWLNEDQFDFVKECLYEN